MLIWSHVRLFWEIEKKTCFLRRLSSFHVCQVVLWIQKLSSAAAEANHNTSLPVTVFLQLPIFPVINLNNRSGSTSSRARLNPLSSWRNHFFFNCNSNSCELKKCLHKRKLLFCDQGDVGFQSNELFSCDVSSLFLDEIDLDSIVLKCFTSWWGCRKRILSERLKATQHFIFCWTCGLLHSWSKITKL